MTKGPAAPDHGRSARRAGAVVILAVMLGRWAATEPTPPAPPAGPGPAFTRAGRAALQPPTRPPPPPAPPPAEPAPPTVEAVTVRVGTWESSGRAFVHFQFRPEGFWPAADEAPFPEGDGVDALIAAVHDQYRTTPTAAVAALTTGLRAGDLPDDPWAALVQLEAERIGAVEDGTAAYAAYLARHGVPDWATDPKGYREKLDSLTEPPPRIDRSRLAELAEQARERWPDHAVADHAGLYLLDALGYDHPVDVGEVAIELLETSEDPIVQRAAAEQIANAGTDAGLGAEDLDVLLGWYEAHGNADHLTLTIAGIDTALALGDLDRAARWMPHHHARAHEICDPEKARIRGFAMPAEWCAIMTSERDNRSSYLAALGHGEPATWQAALGAVARRCHADGHALHAPLTGDGAWSGAWSWSGWSATTSFAACVGDTPHEGPTPPPGTLVRLEVLPPEPSPGALP